ncbi:MAG: hypothetical protein GY725_24870 [bacterium]|nr:hypothetical protein [bacterium]
MIFAIEAGLRLGRKVYDVFVDETVERPLALPVGHLFASIEFADARDFFDLPENRHLTAAGGPYAGASNTDLLVAYKSIVGIDSAIGAIPGTGEGAVEIVQRLHEFEQFKKGFGANHPMQRILGTVVEISIDYFAANPGATGLRPAHRKILQGFLAQIDEIEFAEGERDDIVGEVLIAALSTLGENITLLDDDERLAALLGGVTESLVVDIQSITTQSGQIRREDLFKRIASTIIRGGASAFTENIDLFVPRDGAAKAIVTSTLDQFLMGIEGEEDLFTNESIELLFRGALTAAAENPQIVGDKKILQELLTSTLGAITSTQGKKLFGEEMVARVLGAALQTVSENMATLIDPGDPQKQVAADILAAIAASFATQLAGNGTVQNLLSRDQLLELVRVTFNEVAKAPNQLLGNTDGDPRKSAIAQIIGSVARSLGDDPARFVTGEGFVELVQTTLETAVLNADKLLDLNSLTTRSNGLFKAIQQLVAGVIAGNDPRQLVSRQVFLEIVERTLPVVSANLEALLDGQSNVIRNTVTAALSLAQGALSGRINGANLPVLIEQLLIALAWDELELSESASVQKLALEVLRAAA